jgi:hypothetical protein
MTLNPEIMEMFAKYSKFDNEIKRPVFYRSETPEEVIKKVEEVNDFYLENYGKIFMHIKD